MNFYEFATGSPWLTFFLIWLLLLTILKIINRILRFFTMRKCGYPPPHCDADGDFKEIK